MTDDAPLQTVPEFGGIAPFGSKPSVPLAKPPVGPVLKELVHLAQRGGIKPWHVVAGAGALFGAAVTTGVNMLLNHDKETGESYPHNAAENVGRVRFILTDIAITNGVFLLIDDIKLHAGAAIDFSNKLLGKFTSQVMQSNDRLTGNNELSNERQ